MPNIPPVANAGPPKNVSECNSDSINGYGKDLQFAVADGICDARKCMHELVMTNERQIKRNQ